MPQYLDAYTTRLPPAAERLRGVSLECEPALEVIADYGQQPDALLYVDPPYLASVRRECRYLHEMGGDAEHERLAEALHDCSAAVVLSGYDSPLYHRLYGEWTRTEIRAYADSPIRSGRRAEVVWSSRDLGRHLFSPDVVDGAV